MKFSLFTQYGALNSQPVFASFEQGVKKLGHQTVKNDLNADILVIWSVLWHGRMKSNIEIWKFAKKEKKNLIVLEVGGLIRGKTWRIGLNHINNLANFGKNSELDQDRPEKLKIFLESKRTPGENIIIFGQNSKSEQWSNRPRPEFWLNYLVKSIKNYSDKKIVFRPHPRDYEWVQFLPNLGIDIHIPRKVEGTYDDFDHSKDFVNAYCVFSPSSNPGIQAAIAGIPVFTDTDSLAYSVSNKSLENLINPELPDRKKWLIQICHTEWTLEEIELGIPIKRILDIL